MDSYRDRDDDQDERAWRETNEAREWDTVQALHRCRMAGAREDDLRFLAAELGVHYPQQYEQDGLPL